MIATTSRPPFPLYLAPMELFMEADDAADYPMTFVIQVELSGEIDRSAFHEALHGALARHPLLSALVKRRKKNRWCWTSSDGLTPRVDWSDDDELIACPDNREAIDLAAELGLRIWVRRRPGRAQLTLQFHHACCDGVGAYRFLGDLLAIYGQLTSLDGEQRPELHPIDLGRLRARTRGVLDVALRGAPFRLAKLTLREGGRLLASDVTPLSPAREPNGRRLTPFPSVQSCVFDRTSHEQLRQAAMARGAMLNDLLLAELFLTVRDWNERKTGRAGHRHCVMMPTDMRTGEDYETPAANKVSYTFLTRRARELDRPEELLEGIRRETAAIKSERRGARFADMLAGAFGMGGLMSVLLKHPFCMATAILSNVGDPSRRFTARFSRSQGRIVCGGLILEGITGAPPLRRLTRAAVSVFAYNRCLTLSARCDPFCFNPSDAQEFLSLYAARLRQYTPSQDQTRATHELAAV